MTTAVAQRLSSGETANREVLSLDRSSARRFDGDGHLHVVDCNISKATVNPYFGREIPGHDVLGLDANKTYMMLRHPEELAQSAQTFDGKPLLLHHKPVAANDHAFDLAIGAISDVRYEHPYLKASLHVWPGKAIDAIQSGKQKELSCGYKYSPDMTPGTFEGRAYDGVMRSLSGNHVAIVDEGRAGRDVYVADEKPRLNLEAFAMPTALSRKAALVQGALMVTLGPRMAKDQKLDLAPILKDVTAKNFDEQKPGIVKQITTALDGKLADGANVEDLKTVLDSLSPIVIAEDASDPDDDDETAEEKRKRLAAAAAKKEGGASDTVTKDEMEAALKTMSEGTTKKAVALAREITQAQDAVRPWVGSLAVTCDSAADVYKAALDAIGVKIEENTPPSAYKYILEVQPKAVDRNKVQPSPRTASDKAPGKSFAERFPDAAKVRVGM